MRINNKINNIRNLNSSVFFIALKNRLNIIEIPAGTGQFTQTAGTSALVFKLNGRAPEGAVLTRDEIEDMGYKFQVLTKVAD